jgi:hypothetical protein
MMTRGQNCRVLARPVRPRLAIASIKGIPVRRDHGEVRKFVLAETTTNTFR